ncbi:pyridoxamine 5'-phosphate oxidase family protein [Streptomyces kanamyceticus]|uniref:pyridoxamine 5'-phosphate oxidase family protein n=1 Tax=Streptomyces kanamyceticus TaxID=1967 RepID=UPI0006E2608B|nr:pyridoxamine 5'-phosphate oxidase family protein [Streptomyces kanamyceticus]
MQNVETAGRDGLERRRDTLERLREERDIWVSTGHPERGPHQVPLWFVWHGEALWMCTSATSATARNARAEPRVRLALPDTSDVVLVQGEARCFPAAEVPTAAADAFAAKFGWDPREEEGPYLYVCVTPRTVRAWRGEAELRGRVIMREGDWVPQPSE